MVKTIVRLTDVDDVPLLVDHDVAVVPVLDLEQEPDDRVRGHRGREVPPRLLEGLARLLAKLLLEVLEQVHVDLATDLVAGLGVRYAFYHATLEKNNKGLAFRKIIEERSVSYPGACGYDLVGEEVEVKPGLHEDVLAELDDLEGEHILSAVVSDLE